MPHDAAPFSRITAVYQKVPGRSEGVFAGTAEVEIIPPVPPHVTRRRARVTIVNEDDQTITPTVSRFDQARRAFDSDYRLLIPEAQMLTGEVLVRTDIVLGPGQSVVGSLNVGTSDKPASFDAEWEDEVAVNL